MKTLFVLAGSKQEYDYYTRDNDLKPYEYEPRYATRVEDFMGNRGAEYVTVGTFWERKDAVKLNDAAHDYLTDFSSKS